MVGGKGGRRWGHGGLHEGRDHASGERGSPQRAGGVQPGRGPAARLGRWYV